MICSLLAGCMKNAEAVNFAGDIDLGEDGVITKEVFSQLRDSGEIASICGKSGEISYKWTVPGTEVTNPQDLCMALTITEKTDGSIEITLKSDKSFGFLPTLSVTLKDKWDALSASVYDADGKKLCAASVTGGDKTTLSFKISADVFRTSSAPMRPSRHPNRAIAQISPTAAVPRRTNTALTPCR